MYHFFEAITNTSGDSLVGYFARVVSPVTQEIVSIYADNSGTPIDTVSGYANAATTDESGNLSFYVPAGTYHLDIYAPNTTSFIKRVPNVGMGFPAYGNGDGGSSGSQHVTFVATEGQTRFPASGDFTVDDGGKDFQYDASRVAVSVNGFFIAYGENYMAPGGVVAVTLTSGVPAGTTVVVYGGIEVGAGDGNTSPLALDEVDVATYPGTTTTDDPSRLDHDNTRFANAQADVTDPASPNYGKALRFFPGAGSGMTMNDGMDPTVGFTGTVPAKFRAQMGDWLLDSWSPNGIVEQETPTVIITPNPNEKGNWLPGVVLRARGARFRRPPRAIVRPYILFMEPPPSFANNVGGVLVSADYAIGNRIEGFPTFVGQNHVRGYNENANDIMVSGVTDFYAEVEGLGSASDVLHFGSSAVGPNGSGQEQRRCRNKRVEYHVVADGLNTNNRNVVSVINVDGEVGTINCRRFSKAGGAGALNSFNPATGVSAPGPHDAEPNAFFEQQPFIRNTNVTVYAEDCGAGAAMLLPDNNSFPSSPATENHVRSITAVRCLRGFIMQGGNLQTRPYKINVELAAIECARPYEILSGGCDLKGYARDCPQAAYHGYFATACSALDFHDFEFIRSGAASGVTIEDRGTLGGSARRVKFTDCATINWRHLPPQDSSQLTEKMIYEAVEFSANAAFGHYVDTGAIIRPATVRETGTISNGVSNFRWMVEGAAMKSLPGSGAWNAGQEVRGLPTAEPGGFRIGRAVATNTTGAPTFVVQEQVGGFSDPVGIAIEPFSTLVNMRKGPQGRYTASAPNARAVAPAATSGVFNVQVPAFGTQSVYLGVSSVANPTTPAQILFGIWLGDTTSTGLAVPIAGGNPAGTTRIMRYGDAISMQFERNNSSSITYLPAGGGSINLYTAGVSNVPLYPVILINVAGESLLITGANVNA